MCKPQELINAFFSYTQKNRLLDHLTAGTVFNPQMENSIRHFAWELASKHPLILFWQFHSEPKIDPICGSGLN